LLPSSAQVEIGVKFPLAAYPHENATLEFPLLLALRFGGATQLQEIFDIDKLVVSPFGTSGFVLVVHFFDLLDLLKAEGLGVECHFPELFCLVYRPFFLQFFQVVH